MPLHQDYVEMMKAEHCDSLNLGGRWGECCTAAAYLSQFVNKGVKWAHIDVAGPTISSNWKYATGYGV